MYALFPDGYSSHLSLQPLQQGKSVLNLFCYAEQILKPWAWGISSRLLQRSAAIAPYLGLNLTGQN